MKGIMFKEELFRAVVAGKKTQTRRIVAQTKGSDGIKDDIKSLVGHSASVGHWVFERITGKYAWIFPRYRTGEVIYLKEPYILVYDPGKEQSKDIPCVCYKFRPEQMKFPDGTLHSASTYTKQWKNKMFMPADHARYFIKITRVRCERLQSITYMDAEAEGVGKIGDIELRKGNKPEDPAEAKKWMTINNFKLWWEYINGKDSWKMNPWVWVYEFQLTEKP